MFHTALVPISFRESLAKLKSMTSFLRFLGTEKIVLVHVVSGVRTERSRLRLEELSRTMMSAGEANNEDRSPSHGIEIETRVTSGSPALEITRVARDVSAGFIAIPWKRKSWLQRTLVGSTTQDIVRLTDHHLFIFKGSRFVGASSGQGFSVLYATDLGAVDDTVLPFLNWPGLNAERVLLVHVGRRAPDPEAENRRRRAIDLALEELRKRCATTDRTVETLNRTGNPARAIRHAARREQADLVVIGRSEAAAGVTGALGTTADTIAYSAPQSVLVVGRGGSGEE